MGGKTDDPVALLVIEHDAQLRVCDLLEDIADSLPDSVNPLLMGTIHQILDHCFILHMRFESEQLFPILNTRIGDNVWLQKILDQLKREHHRDECSLWEVMEEFEELGKGRKCRNPEMLGYLLRGFFEGQRSHIELENSAVLPFARTVLQPADVQGMTQWLGVSGHGGISEFMQRVLQSIGGPRNRG